MEILLDAGGPGSGAGSTVHTASSPLEILRNDTQISPAIDEKRKYPPAYQPASEIGLRTRHPRFHHELLAKLNSQSDPMKAKLLKNWIKTNDFRCCIESIFVWESLKRRSFTGDGLCPVHRWQNLQGPSTGLSLNQAQALSTFAALQGEILLVVCVAYRKPEQGAVCWFWGDIDQGSAGSIELFAIICSLRKSRIFHAANPI